MGFMAIGSSPFKLCSFSAAISADSSSGRELNPRNIRSDATAFPRCFDIGGSSRDSNYLVIANLKNPGINLKQYNTPLCRSRSGLFVTFLQYLEGRFAVRHSCNASPSGRSGFCAVRNILAHLIRYTCLAPVHSHGEGFLSSNNSWPYPTD